MGRPNLSRETKFSGPNGDRDFSFLYFADHEQDWQPNSVEAYSVEGAGHTYINIWADARKRYIAMVPRHKGVHMNTS